MSTDPRSVERWDSYDEKPRGNGMAVAALVSSLFGLFVLGILFGALGIVFGALGLQRASRGASRRGVAMAGLIIGVVDVVLYLVLLTVASGWHV